MDHAPLPPEQADPLHEAALAVEADEQLASEMAEWDVTAGDGIADPQAPSPQ